MHIQTQGGLLAAAGPPAKSPLGKPLLTQPKSLAIIDQNLQGLSAAIGEDKQCARQRIGVELLAADLHQPVNAFAIIPLTE